MSVLTVEKLIKDGAPQLGLKLVAGRSGISRIIKSPQVQKPGLALTGLTHIDTERVQILGEKEILYLDSLTDDELSKRLESLMCPEVPCVVVTRNLDISPLILQRADDTGTPLCRTSLSSAELIQVISRYFEEAFSRFTTMHGVLVEVFGVGVIIIGASGVGKSECALDLISRGHRLVADDVVDVTISSDNVLIGSSAHLIKHHMEVRGLGIINVRDIFGIASVCDRHSIDLVVELVDWDQRREYDRLGLDERTYTILDLQVALIQIPVSPGRNLTTIVEVAARNQLLKLQGVHSARELHRKLSWAIGTEQALMSGNEGEDDEE